MSATALRKLTIKHLRGSVKPFTLFFHKDKKLTVIYGENGTGKSTICDALEFLGRGAVGSLDGRGLGATTSYWHSLNMSAADISVELETTGGSCVASVRRSAVVATPDSARPCVEVLRRSQILSLMEATPARRYEAISRFVNVSDVEASEGSLRQLIRELTESRKVAVARVQENKDAIEQFWTTAGAPGRDPFTWAAAEAKRDPNASDSEMAAIAILQTDYARLGLHPTRLRDARKRLADAQQAVDSARASEQVSLEAASADAADLVDILRAATRYLGNHPYPPTCPLCESRENVFGLSARVAKRIADFSTLQSARTVVAAKQTGTQAAELQLQNAIEAANSDIATFFGSATGTQWPADVEMPPSYPTAEEDALTNWLTETANLPGVWRKAVSLRQDKKQFISTLKKALKTWTENVAAQKELDTLIPRLEKALQIAEQERRLYTDGVLAGIAAEVCRLYEQVHPGEGLNQITLDLNPARRASLDINAEFQGKSVPPQAYFSDSHLDTLGLCVFLALAAMDSPTSKILVLDDVLASVDEPHVERLIEMLYEQALRFRHCVITTHYRPWKQKLRWGWLQHGQCEFIELTKWSSASGLSLVRSVPELHLLRTRLAESPPDLQGICAKAGVVLEAALEFLTVHYECSVPRKADGNYTLGDLLPAIDKKLRAALRVDIAGPRGPDGGITYVPIPLAPALEELSRIAQTRNVFGCHFSRVSFELLDADAIRFGEQVVALVEALVDTEAGWPRNGKSGSYWATAGETRRLYPFRRPT